jgi:hypothetical protein
VYDPTTDPEHPAFDPSRVWPAGIATDEALRQLDRRVTALEPEQAPASADEPVAVQTDFVPPEWRHTVDGPTGEELAEFREWRQAQRDASDLAVSRRVESGLDGGNPLFDTGSPAALPATGAGPGQEPTTGPAEPAE